MRHLLASRGEFFDKGQSLGLGVPNKNGDRRLLLGFACTKRAVELVFAKCNIESWNQYVAASL